MNIHKYSIENFRGISIIAVMLSHLGSYLLPNERIYLSILFGDVTTFFVFISGYLFSHVYFEKEFNFFNYIYKKIKFIAAPYLILSTPVIIAGMYYSRPELLGLSRLEYLGWSLFVGGSVITPMWYMPVIFIFFLFSPLLFRLKSDLILYFFTLIFMSLSLFTGRPYSNANPILSFFHFFGFYLFGMFAYNIRNYISNISKNESIIIICFFTLIFSITSRLSIGINQEATFFSDLGKLNLITLGKLAILISIFLYLNKFQDTKNQVLGYFAKISFGLYFIHGFYMAVFFKFILPHIESSASRFLFEFFTVIFLSFVTVFLIKTILKRSSRYVIGC